MIPPEISVAPPPLNRSSATTSAPRDRSVPHHDNIRDLSGNRTLVRFGSGDEVTVTAGPEGVRFLLVAGRPLKEPVAWHGPIVMNTRAELMQARQDLNNGTFIRSAH